MADKSGIAWTDATWNPATGCTKVSAGCKFCYAKHKAWPRLSKNPATLYYGRAFENVRTHPERLDQPLRWTKPRMVFVNSMSDLFHKDIPDEFIEEVFAVMALASQHIFQVLTKRAERMRDFLNDTMRWAMIEGRAQRRYNEMTGEDPSLWLAVNSPLPNVWLGVSVENQDTADERIPVLLQTPAAVRWISAEPLLNELSLAAWIGDRQKDAVARRRAGLSYNREFIDWVVIGGESGPKARPMERHWPIDIVRQCKDAGVPVFMKQGSQANWPHWRESDIDYWLQELRIRQYPHGV